MSKKSGWIVNVWVVVVLVVVAGGIGYVAIQAMEVNAAEGRIQDFKAKYGEKLERLGVDEQGGLVKLPPSCREKCTAEHDGLWADDPKKKEWMIDICVNHCKDKIFRD